MVVNGLGLEPRMSEPKSEVLPITPPVIFYSLSFPSPLITLIIEGATDTKTIIKIQNIESITFYI